MRSPFPVPCPWLPLTRCTPSRRSSRPPMCTTPPTPPTTSSPLSPPTPPQSTRPSTFPCTLSRPTSSPELPTLTPPPLPTWPPLPLLTLPPLLTALLLVPATPPLASSDMWLLPTKCSHTFNLSAVQPKNFHLPVHVWKLFSVQKAHFPLVCPV